LTAVSLPRSALGLSKLRIGPCTERGSHYVLAHAITAREAAKMLDCTPGEVEAMVQARILVGRHIKLALSRAEGTAQGRLWIVCAACALP
jgi:hypothetical protein